MHADTNDNNVENATPSNAKSGGPLSGSLGIVLFLILFAVAGVMTYRAYTVPEREAPKDIERVFICSGTGATFMHAMELGETLPVLSPHTNKKTGYPAEACYWIEEDGEWKRLKTPVYVLLNAYVGKKGDTFCPVCGRLVVGHNEQPPPGTPLATNPAPAASQPKPTSTPGE